MINMHDSIETSVNLFDLFGNLPDVFEWAKKFREGKYQCFTYQGSYIVRKEGISCGTYDKDGLIQFCQSL